MQSPALYWHFKNKRELLDELAAVMLSEGHNCRFPTSGQDWREFLAENARSFRRSLLAYRDGARVHAGTHPNPEQFPAIEAQTRHLCEAGFSPAEAIRGGILIGRYVVGWVIEEQAEPTDVGGPSLKEMYKGFPSLEAGLRVLEQEGSDADFEYGLQVIIAGMASRLDSTPAKPRTRSREPMP